MKRAEITVFLSLVLVLLLSLVAVLIESAGVQLSKNYKRADMDIALESVFAEYQQELLKYYHIFAIEGTYETGDFSYGNISERLSFYSQSKGLYDVRAATHLSDDQGHVFQYQISQYILGRGGTSASFPAAETALAEEKNQYEEYLVKEEEIYNQMEEGLTESEEALPTEGNPLVNISNLKQSSLLSMVVSDQETLSQNVIELHQTPSNRELARGFGVGKADEKGGLLTKAALTEYLIHHFSNYTDGNFDHPLAYEIEYILCGKGSDRENLEGVIKKLIGLRFVPNYAYLLSSGSKQAEAQALALSLCTILTVPAISELVKQAILLAWAYGESIMDMRTLLKGNKVELVKNEENWQLSLSSLLKLGTSEDQMDGRDMAGGLGYQEYLKMLILLEDKDKMSMRGLDVIEQNMQKVYCISFFKVDFCLTQLEIHSTYSLRRHLTYDFHTQFSYQ